MSTYAIGDIQGCLEEFNHLLDIIKFDTANDRLWLTGDLVNRGPDSLGTLRLAKELSAISVMGNHECHLLAIAGGISEHRKKDTLLPVLDAEDCEDLLDWIRTFPLIHTDEDLGFIMVHAGIHPAWDIEKTMELANEVAVVLQSEHYPEFLKEMYGDKPDQWSDSLAGWDRLRCIINYFTRTRFYTRSGQMNFNDKGPPGTQTRGFYPWYSLTNKVTSSFKILFGHWASLQSGDPRDFKKYNVFPLDTGCVWGRTLTALRLEDMQVFQVHSLQGD